MSNDKPEFKKVTTEETKSHLLPVNYEQVEDEVLAAKDEANAEVTEVSETAPEVVKHTGGVVKTSDKATVLLSSGRDYDRDLAVKDELKSMVDGKVRPEPHGLGSKIVAQLRLKDRIKKNKTCSRCGRRVLLAKIDGGKADICDDCK